MKTKKGFTLIELMIVVAIIGILAAVAIPKFADLIQKSKEGATKGSLGAIRSALTIYYGETEGIYPTDAAGITSTPFCTKYIDKIPTVKLGISTIADTNAVVDLDAGTLQTGDTGSWGYLGSATGDFYVSCIHTDTKGTKITTW